MPKKTWTDAERLAFGAKMKAARDAKAATAQPNPLQAAPEAPIDVVDEVRNGVSETEYHDLLNRFKELEARLTTQPQQQIPQLNARGGLTGTLEKYVTLATHYPDPRPRLLTEPKLAHLAFAMNYEFSWDVTVTSYQTQDGINTKEPRFNLNLIRIMLDEDTGEPTNGRYIVRKLMFHEDPEAALVVARDNNFDMDTLTEANFLNEMRYLRMRDWLLGIFYPPKAEVQSNKTQRVIGNQLVDFYTVNSEETTSIPFDQLKSKLK